MLGVKIRMAQRHAIAEDNSYYTLQDYWKTVVSLWTLNALLFDSSCLSCWWHCAHRSHEKFMGETTLFIAINSPLEWCLAGWKFQSSTLCLDHNILIFSKICSYGIFYLVLAVLRFLWIQLNCFLKK